jgi:hypothetical protein
MSELFDVMRIGITNAMIGTVGATVAFILVELVRRHV